jgi:hypothetical protein
MRTESVIRGDSIRWSLSLTHILDFMLSVHWHYAFRNVGPYRVTDLKYLKRGLLQSLDNPVQVTKLLILDLGTFYPRNAAAQAALSSYSIPRHGVDTSIYPASVNRSALTGVFRHRIIQSKIGMSSRQVRGSSPRATTLPLSEQRRVRGLERRKG